MIYLELFLVFFQIGLFSIGGGYAALPLIKLHVVEQKHWLNMKEFTDLLTIAEMTPGPIAINSSTFVGTKVAGLPGAIIATLGNVAPSCIIVLSLAFIYSKYKNLTIFKGILEGLRPGVVAMIASAGISILILSFFNEGLINIDSVNFISIIIFILSIIAIRKFKVNPIKVIASCGVLGFIVYSII